MAENGQQALIDIAVDSWRFTRLFLRMANKLDAGEASRYISQYKFYVEKLEENLQTLDLRLVNLEGQSYDPGMAIKPLNIEDFSGDEPLLIDQMLEPIVMNNDGLVRPGTAMLRKVAA